MKRASGILLHPVSLPSPHGIGTMGRAAREFIDFLTAAGQQVWQILPLGPTGYGDSPYNALSAFAGNPLLIDFDCLVAAGDLQPREAAEAIAPDGPVNYADVHDSRARLLRVAVNHFRAGFNGAGRRREFDQFCTEQAVWLDDYVLFMAIREHLSQKSWAQWPEAIKLREPSALQEIRTELADELFYHRYIQFVFHEQWQALKTYAVRQGVRIMGDIPIFVAYDSADVWAHQDIFQLDQQGQPRAIAGVPPDYFSETGQLWGNPLYDWDRLSETDFAWWRQRFHHQLERVDLARIDHFRGFQACWSVPADEKTAINGHWEEVPGAAFFRALCRDIPASAIIAEDLGMITPEVDALREAFHFPGMKVLHFAFDSGPDNPYLPHNHVPHCVVYTGTHDNNTTVGWWRSLDKATREQVKLYLEKKRPDIPWDIIEMALASVAELCIIPCQDILSLDQSARFNRPGRADGNWRWRLQPGDLDEKMAAHLQKLVVKYNRQPTSD